MSEIAVAAYDRAAHSYRTLGINGPGLYVRSSDGRFMASATAAKPPASRAELRDLLRTSGLTKSRAEKAATAAWRALQPEEAVADATHRIGRAIRSFQARRDDAPFPTDGEFPWTNSKS